MMKWKCCSLWIVISILLLIGCSENKAEQNKENNREIGSENDESRGNNMNGISVYDFTNIKKAPESKKRHSSDEIIKLYFSENNSSLTNRIAIDIENYEIYIDPLMSARGLDTLDGTTDLEDAEKLIKMLDLYDVLEWKREYNLHATESYEDGYSWRLWLQFKDGTVQKHEGNEEDLAPENFEEFVTELSNFVEEQLDEG
ncbi:MAG TPA: hypothetical protein VK072_00905 [Candidatus Avamphibacillus sp.]|nr:hypothetical protein [Candidatus Avamphibacillus sp.]